MEEICFDFLIETKRIYMGAPIGVVEIHLRAKLPPLLRCRTAETPPPPHPPFAPPLIASIPAPTLTWVLRVHRVARSNGTKPQEPRYYLATALDTFLSFQLVLHDWCNKGRGMLSCLWDDAYKRTLAANRKE